MPSRRAVQCAHGKGVEEHEHTPSLFHRAYISNCVHVHKRHVFLDPLELELQVAVSHLIRVFQQEQRAISPAPSLVPLIKPQLTHEGPKS